MATSFGDQVLQVIEDHPEYDDSQVAVAARAALSVEYSAIRAASQAAEVAADLALVALIRERGTAWHLPRD